MARAGITHNLDKVEAFVRSHKLSAKGNQEKVRKALYNTGAFIARLILEEEPRPPVLYGNLWGSIQIFVTDGGVVTFDNPPPVPQGEENQGTAHKIELSPPDRGDMGEFEVRVQMSVPYAERLHEKPFEPGPISEQAGGVGHLFMRRKIERFKKEIEEQFVLELRRAGYGA